MKVPVTAEGTTDLDPQKPGPSVRRKGSDQMSVEPLSIKLPIRVEHDSSHACTTFTPCTQQRHTHAEMSYALMQHWPGPTSSRRPMACPHTWDCDSVDVSLLDEIDKT